jgi:hypothetical protein
MGRGAAGPLLDCSLAVPAPLWLLPVAAPHLQRLLPLLLQEAAALGVASLHRPHGGRQLPLVLPPHLRHRQLAVRCGRLLARRCPLLGRNHLQARQVRPRVGVVTDSCFSILDVFLLHNQAMFGMDMRHAVHCRASPPAAD